MRRANVTKLPGKVYFVQASNDSTVLIAMDVVTDGEIVCWFDTVKQRVMGIEKILDERPDHFVFERASGQGGGIYTFVPMTLALYHEKVKPHILVPRTFDSEEEMLRALESTRKDAW